MLDELIKSIILETVKLTLQELKTSSLNNSKVSETLTPKQLAEYLGMSESWVYQHTKELPHEKRGRRTLFIKSEIDEWRQNQRADMEDKTQNIVHVSSASSEKNRRGYYKVV